jgi:MFS family permease
MFALAPRSGTVILSVMAAYGALAYTLYSIAVAHANDHAGPEDFVKVSGGLLLLYGFGTMIGPLAGAFLMERMRPEGLFLATAAAHLALGAYALVRVRARAAVPVGEREAFKTLPSERAATPQAVLLDPRSETEGEDTGADGNAADGGEAQPAD